MSNVDPTTLLIRAQAIRDGTDPATWWWGIDAAELLEEASSNWQEAIDQKVQARLQVSEALGRETALQEQLGVKEQVLEDIVRWSEAYPLSVFPEPDLEKARRLLEAGGMTLDAISASNMRHVITEVGKMARAALTGEKTP